APAAAQLATMPRLAPVIERRCLVNTDVLRSLRCWGTSILHLAGLFRSNDRLIPYNARMTIRAIAAIVATAGGLLGFRGPTAAQSTAQDNALRVLVSNGMKGSMEELQPQCEKAVGRSLAIKFGSTASL